MRTAGVVKVIGLISLGVVAGYLFFDRSAELQQLKAQISQLESTAKSGSESIEQPDSRPLRPHAPAVPSSAEIPANSENAPHISSIAPITEEDLKVACELNERSRGGEYILAFERPTDRKFRAACIDDLVERMSSNSAPKLDVILDRLAVRDDAKRQLEFHQKKIQKASLEAEMALEQLSEARLEYDQRARATMDDTQYGKYRDYEGSQSAVREYNKIEEFQAAKGAELSSTDKETTIALIRDLQAYTESYTHGPYDSLPDIAIGTDAVVNKLTRELTQLTEATAHLQERGVAYGIPDGQSAVLNNYYSEQIARKQSAIQRFLAGPQH